MQGYQMYKAQEGAGSGSFFGTLLDIFRPAEQEPPPEENNPFGNINPDDLMALWIAKEFGVDPTTGQPLPGGGIGRSSSQSSGQSTQSTLASPPVLDILAEMRERRNSEAARANIISSLLSNNTPRGQNFYLGFEPGGLADVLLGIITGQGPSAAAGILPAGQRAVRTTAVPIPGAEPSVGAEFGGAKDMGNLILDAIRNIQTGQSSQQSSSTSGP